MESETAIDSARTRWADYLMQRPADREVITPDPEHSVRWFEHDYPTDLARWNYHPEYEIHLIRKGTGRFIAGDHVGTFEAGQVTLIGSGLPHDWVSDIEPGQTIEGRDALVQFDGAWLERCMEIIPELTQARALLLESSRGILFSGTTREAAAREIESMGATSHLKRLSHLVTLLAVLAGAPRQDKRLLAEEWFSIPSDSLSQAAVEEGLDYIFKNLGGRITLAEAAHRARMSEPTFSRYFKQASGHTFTSVVRRLRISHARMLLEQTNRPVASICFEVGFTNLSNFNRQFLEVVGQTPRQFRRTAATSR